jgi:hypothetical protein
MQVEIAYFHEKNQNFYFFSRSFQRSKSKEGAKEVLKIAVEPEFQDHGDEGSKMLKSCGFAAFLLKWAKQF